MRVLIIVLELTLSLKEIKDIEFHGLRVAYIEAAKALEDYCGLEII
jgi:hypothetical protein